MLLPRPDSYGLIGSILVVRPVLKLSGIHQSRDLFESAFSVLPFAESEFRHLRAYLAQRKYTKTISSLRS